MSKIYDKLVNKEATLAVIGLGYVGLPIALEFAKKIKVTQSNLSKMENGKRPIGKMVAQRIAKEFDVNYRYFLE